MKGGKYVMNEKLASVIKSVALFNAKKAVDEVSLWGLKQAKEPECLKSYFNKK